MTPGDLARAPFEDAIGTTRWRVLCAITDMSTTTADALREFVVSDGDPARLAGIIADLRAGVDKLAALAHWAEEARNEP